MENKINEQGSSQPIRFPAGHATSWDVRLKGLAWVLVGIFLAIIWARTGLVPAASAGDEIWWSDSGFQFMREGVLRWDCLSDDKGSGIISFWPPVTPLLQALMMKIFGVNAFGVFAQSSLVCTLIMGAVYLLCRSLKFSVTRSLLAACAIFGLLMVDRRLLQVRMENLTGLAAVAFAWLIIRANETLDRRWQFGLAMLAGVSLGVGVFCYYPQSPFLLLACCAAFLIVRRADRVRLVGAVFLGSLPALLGALFWMAPHWELFRRQVLDAGTKHWLSFSNLAGAATQLLHVSSVESWLTQWERWIVLALAMLGLKCAKSANLKMIAAMALASSLPMFLYQISPQVGAGLLGVVLIFGLAVETDRLGAARFLKVTQVVLLLAAAVKLGMVGFSAYYQREGRNYDPVKQALRQAVDAKGPVAIGQRAWLGLREVVPPGDLHLLVYSGFTLDYMPVRAKNPNADDYFRFLVLEMDKVTELRDVYPWIGRAIDTGKFRLVATIKPPFKPLPWAKGACYDLVVYKRTSD